MRHADFIDTTEDAANGFALLLESADHTTPVSSCPGWSLVELAVHLGGVHRWARAQLLGGGQQLDRQTPDAPLADRDALVAWFREGAADLVATLRELPEDAPCWALYPPARASTWARRQALETALHLWDASDSLGIAVPIRPDLAAAGVAEVAEDMYPRQVALGRMPSLEERVDLRMLDRLERPGDGGSFGLRVRLGPVDETPAGTANTLSGARPADATLELTAEAALLLLWKRRDLAAVGARVTGSREVLERVLGNPLAP
ncbi:MULTISPECIES: maleylpyruvate isomerase family mycothiol-dependent enzyme [unclassified Pseudoclavibacter]|uniref:maleylpyruvate isomerase family mycothiol-dependent enzyme n=1 Tax=unclassified Pseudoclavibacter TaxID=2615177 RepID=UPI001BA4D699|nr:maleylpyruvate isomerase family mycothiol-dependent enzyme [Pseudoclavibacter sp. Marseille-Q4354]MBS3178700.1 maleylpyruvate isomerase family mycothiol-dependent enzyme [Pseudoclavibacter sp. Marseille-Q4354]